MLQQSGTNREATQEMYFGDINVGARLITKNELTFVFPAKMPILPGHLLLCPVRRVETVDELSDDEFLALMSLLIRTKKALSLEFSATGFNVAWNEGLVAGQTVPHLHIHVVPRQDLDGGITEYEPRKFLYRPGIRDSSPEEELIEVARALSKHFR